MNDQTKRTRTAVKEHWVPRELRVLLQALTIAVAAAHFAGPTFDAILIDLLMLKLTVARLIDALCEAKG